MHAKQFRRYLRYANTWLRSIKKRPLDSNEEAELYHRLEIFEREYNFDEEVYDLATELCIATAKIVMEMHPDVDEEEKISMEHRIRKVVSKLKK